MSCRHDSIELQILTLRVIEYFVASWADCFWRQRALFNKAKREKIPPKACSYIVHVWLNTALQTCI